MSWSIGFDNDWDRDIGYGVPCEEEFITILTICAIIIVLGILRSLA
jgi:hypothetical protein